MITILGDTHGRDGLQLRGPIREAIRTADALVHTGDFLTQSVLDAFLTEHSNLIAVHGNNDSSEVRERLPAIQIFEAETLRIVLVHGHEHGHTHLSFLSRQESADLVIVGHSHNPQFVIYDDVSLLNPGSHAVPRGFQPAFATLEETNGAVHGQLIQPDGTVFEEFVVARRAEGREEV